MKEQIAQKSEIEREREKKINVTSLYRIDAVEFYLNLPLSL